MHELMANMKKDFLGGIRSKKIFAYIFIPIGLLIFSIITIFLLDAIMAGEMEEGMVQSPTRDIAFLMFFFTGSMSAYFVIPMIFMLMGSVSKEMKEKKWLLPICNGMDNKKMILSKCIVNALIPTAFAFIGGLLAIACGYIFFDNMASLTFFDLFLQVLTMSVNVLFYAVMTISLSALTKRYILSAGIPMLLIMVASNILGELNAICYTPFLFSVYSVGMEVLWWQWLIATAGVIIVDGALVMASMFKKRVVYM